MIHTYLGNYKTSMGINQIKVGNVYKIQVTDDMLLSQPAYLEIIVDNSLETSAYCSEAVKKCK